MRSKHRRSDRTCDPRNGCGKPRRAPDAPCFSSTERRTNRSWVPMPCSRCLWRRPAPQPTPTSCRCTVIWAVFLRGFCRCPAQPDKWWGSRRQWTRCTRVHGGAYGAPSFPEALRAGAEIFHHLKKCSKARAWQIPSGMKAVLPGTAAQRSRARSLMTAIGKAGYKAGVDVGIAMDVAASEVFLGGQGHLQSRWQELVVKRACRGTSTSQVAPICSIEDGMAEDDWTGWKQLTDALGRNPSSSVMTLFVTNPLRLRRPGLTMASPTRFSSRSTRSARCRRPSTRFTGQTPRLHRHHLAPLGRNRRHLHRRPWPSPCRPGQIKTGSASRSGTDRQIQPASAHHEQLGTAARYAGRALPVALGKPKP